MPSSPKLHLGGAIAALFFLGFAALADSANAQTWTGATSGNFSTASNWASAPAFNGTTDLFFGATSANATANGSNSFLGSNLTVRSISYGADADTDLRTRFTTTRSGNAPASLFFSASTGNSSITIAAGAAADIEFTAGTTPGSLVLGTQLAIDHNGSGIFSVAPPITGSYGIEKAGTGSLTLAGNNTYSGATSISGGTLSIATIANGGTASGLGASGSSASNLILGGGTLLYTGGNASTDRDFTLSNGTASTVSVASATETLTLMGAAAAGNGSLTKAGPGTLSLSGANLHSGNTTVSAGTLALANANALQYSTLNTGVSGAQAVAFAAPGNTTYHLGGLAGADALDIGGNSLNAGANNADTTFSGILGGTGNLSKTGNGTLTLSGANTYSGKTAINGGSISINSDARLGTAPASAVADQLALNGGTLLATSSFTINSTRGITLGPLGGTLEAAASTTLSYGGSIAGPGGSLSKTGAGTLSLSGNNTYTGTTTVNAGTLSLNGAASSITIAGDVLVNGGTLDYQSSANEQISNSANVTIADGLFAMGARSETITSLDMQGGNLTRGGATLTLLGPSRFTGGNVTFSAAAAGIATSTDTVFGNVNFVYSSPAQASAGLVLGGNFSVNPGTSAVFSNSEAGAGEIDLGPATRSLSVDAGGALVSNWFLSGSGGISKTGNGTLTLNGANTYTGATTVNSGTLVLNGSSTGSAISVNDGGTLAGTGTGGATTIQAGGAVSPGGAGIGTLSTGNLTLNAGGSYIFTIGNTAGTAGTEWDLIRVGSGAGTVAVNSTSNSPFTVAINGNPTGWNPTGNFSWSIVSAGNTTGFSAEKFAVDPAGFTPGSGPGTFYLSTASGGLVLNYAVLSTSVWGGGTGTWSAGFSPQPANLYNLSFEGAGGGTATNDIAPATLQSAGGISFAAGAGSFTLDASAGASGSNSTVPLVLTGAVANNSPNAQNIALALSLGATRTFDTAAGNITLSGQVSGSGGIAKTGAHTLLVAGNNTFSGGVSVDEGTLATSGTGGFANTANVTVASGASYSVGASDQIQSLNSAGTLVLSAGNLTVSGTASSLVSGPVSGAGNLTKGGAGILALSSNNTGYTGQTRLEGGILEIGHDGALGAGSLLIRGNGVTVRSSNSDDRTVQTTLGTFGGTSAVYTFGSAGSGNLTFGSTTSASLGGARTFNVLNSSTRFNGALTGSGDSLAKTGAGTLILAGNNTYTGATTINAGTLQIGAGGTSGRLNANSPITTNATLAFNRSNSIVQGADFSGTIAGTGAVAQIGTGTLTLNGTNTYSGGTFLNSGTLDLRHASALGSGNFTISGGTLANNSGANLTLSTNNPQTWGGNFAFSGTGALDLGTGDVKLNGARTVDVASGNLTVGGTVSNAGSYYSGGLAKEGAGTLRFTGNLSYGGTNTVNNGTVVLAGTGAGGSSTVVNGGTLRTEGGGRIGWGDLAIGAGGSVSLAGSQAIAALSGSGNLSISGALSLGGGGSGVFSGVVAGNGSLVVPETKVLVLSGNNSYSGGTRVAGNLFVGSDNALGTGPLQMGDGGFLWTPPARLASADSEDRTIANAISAFDSEPESIIFGQAGTGNLTFTSTAAASLWGIPWIKIENQSTKLHNSLAGSGGGLTKLGTGDLILAGNNTHTGETRIYQGLLAVEGGQAIANTAAVNLDNTAGVVFEVRSSETIGSLRGGGTTGGLASILSGQTLTVAETGTNTYSGATGGAGALVKSGNGTLALGGDAAHSGGTTVGAGTLRINGTHASAITVQSGATLGGNGSIAGMVALNANAKLAPGNSVGTLTFSNGLTLNSTSTVTMEINGADSFDSVNVTGGTLGYAGTLSLVFGYGAEVGDTYNLFVRSGGAGYSGNFGALLFNYGGYAGEFDAEAGSLTLTAVPEPQIWCLIALGCAFLLLRMRRRGNAARA
jgi:autotransporter-associated beta strand protein